MKPTPLLVIGIIFAASFMVRGVEVARAAGEASAPAPVQKTAAKADKAKHTPKDKHADKAHDADKMSDQKMAAQTGDHDAKSGDMSKDAQKSDYGDGHGAKPNLDDFAGKAPTALLAEIRDRAVMLDKREAVITERERTLQIIEKRVEDKIASLKRAQAQLEERLTIAEGAAKSDIARLARMYENMKPAKAGEIFNAMEPSFAAGFLTEMTSDSAAKIMANMETDKAYAASIIIAGRNADLNTR